MKTLMRLEVDLSKEPQLGLFLKILLNRTHGQVPQYLIQALPERYKEAYKHFTLSQTNPLPLLKLYQPFLYKMHYSWIAHYLNQQPFEKRTPLIAALSKDQQKNLISLNKLTQTDSIKSSLLQRFYLPELIQTLEIDKHLPIEYLPDSPLKGLLSLTKLELLELIDLLGVYDLSHEMSQIVATKNLKSLHACLSFSQHQFFRKCLHYKDKINAPPLKLDHWDGDCNTLKKLLHRRGLTRLSLALPGQHDDFVWYLSRTLDSGRGKSLQKLIRPDTTPKLIFAIGLQVENALKFLLENKK